MSKIPSTALKLSIGGVGFECNTKNAGLDMTRESIKTDGFCSDGPERVPANYDHNLSADGDNDFDSGAIDATLYGLLTDANPAAGIYDPTGAGTPAADAPIYSSDYVLASYSLKAALGQSQTFTTRLDGAAALDRAVA